MARLVIQNIAKAKGLNRSQLQLRSRVTLPMLTRYWKNQTESVTLDALERIAAALEVKPGDLIVSDAEYQTSWSHDQQDDDEPEAA